MKICSSTILHTTSSLLLSNRDFNTGYKELVAYFSDLLSFLGSRRRLSSSIFQLDGQKINVFMIHMFQQSTIIPLPLNNNYSMKRLDLCHHHPKLEVPGLTCPGRESNPGLHGGRRALQKRAIRTAC
jgi:hypothetical protein